MTSKQTSQDKSYITALSIAGLDPSGGAGLLADVKTFSALGVYGAAVATALTVQNTMGVKRVEAVSAETVYSQTAAVMDDLNVQAVKVGMLNDSNTVSAVAKAMKEYRPHWLVVDPILLSSNGAQLMQDEAYCTFVEELLPLADLLTPNLPEACRLSERPFHTDISLEETEEMARIILSKGAHAVLIKGGHRSGDSKSDVLFRLSDGHIEKSTFTADTILTHNTHGTGCTLSAAITSYLACGEPLDSAISKAKLYLTQALREGADVQCGHGHGSVNHFFKPQPLLKR